MSILAYRCKTDEFKNLTNQTFSNNFLKDLLTKLFTQIKTFIRVAEFITIISLCKRLYFVSFYKTLINTFNKTIVRIKLNIIS